jgi:TonB family protein
LVSASDGETLFWFRASDIEPRSDKSRKYSPHQEISQLSPDFDRSTLSPDQRVHDRQAVQSVAYVELGGGNGGIVLNISEGGMAFRAVRSLPSDELPLMRVKVAHFKKTIEVKGRIAWTSESRKLAGIRFVDLSQESLNLIRQWISFESPATPDASSQKIEPVGAAKNVAHVGAIVDPPALSDRWEIIKSPMPPVESKAIPATAATFATTPTIVPPIVKAPVAPPHSAPEPEQIRTSAELPINRFVFKPVIPQLAAKGASANARLAAWLGALALAFFAAGWLAGHGSLHGVFEGATSKILDEKISTQRSPQRPALNITNKTTDSLLPSSPPSSLDILPSADAHSREANSSLPPTVAPVHRGKGLQAGKLVHRVEPIYPPDAISQRIEGAVKLYAVIDEEGNIQTLRLLSGPQALASAAVSAVSQWRYSPTLLDGHPIETERQITIAFKLVKTP